MGKHIIAFILFLTVLTGSVVASDKTGLPVIPGLIVFWDFQEKPGEPRISKGPCQYALYEMNGPISRADDGIFGRYSIDFEWGQWLRARHSDVAQLDLHGDGQELSMVVWVKRESDRVWQFIAGMWDEGTKKYKGKTGGTGKEAPARQYAMFINGYWQSDYTTYARTRAQNQVHGYVSSTGGASPGHPFAFDYATGKTKLEKDRWYMIAYTYDRQTLRVYVDGEIDSNENFNPFNYSGSIYNAGENGADFTVAQRHVPFFPTYPDGKPENDAGFDGRIGGLAIYNRAMSDLEIKELYLATMPAK